MYRMCMAIHIRHRTLTKATGNSASREPTRGRVTGQRATVDAVAPPAFRVQDPSRCGFASFRLGVMLVAGGTGVITFDNYLDK